MEFLNAIANFIKDTLLTTKGDIMVRGASEAQRLASGAVHTVLKGAGAGELPAWSEVDRVKCDSLYRIRITDPIVFYWNMDADSSKDIAHGLDPADIVAVFGTIHDDGGTAYWPLTVGNAIYSGVVELCMYSIDATNVQLRRKAAGIFDNTSYDSTVTERGYLQIAYKETIS